MPNSDYGVPADRLERSNMAAEMALRYPEGFARHQAATPAATGSGAAAPRAVLTGEMNQLQALRETIALAEKSGMAAAPGSELGLDHLRRMLDTVEQSDSFSPAKLGRWLGWAQCAVVAAGVGVSLDDMKELNTRHQSTHRG